MEHEREKFEVERQLARCRKLTAEYQDGPTAQHLLELEQELLEKLRKLQQQ
jgi:hypothetical protein